MKKPKFEWRAATQKIKQILRSKKFRLLCIGLTASIVVINVGLALYYREKLYPKTQLANQQVGGKTINQVEKMAILPEQVTLKSSTKQIKQKVSDTGVKVNWQETGKQLKSQKNWLPIVSVLRTYQYQPALSIDEPTLDKTANQLAEKFVIASQDASLKTEGETVTLTPAKSGQQIDPKKLKQALTEAISLYQNSIEVPSKTTEAKVSNIQLQEVIDKFKTTQQKSFTFTYGSSTKKVTSAEILAWHDVNPTSVTLSPAKVRAFIIATGNGWGIQVKNIDQLTAATVSSIEQQKDLAANVEAAPKIVKQYSFCIRAKGVSEAYLPEFAAKFGQTLNDARSWSLGGQVSFVQSDSSCNIIAWLSAAELVPTFSSVCDSTWSCAVAPNVIINFDRWTGASPAWNAAGGSLDDYRSMVINHETGHWFGFHHRYCGGAGQPAPVMQQQSINLQGCAFNPWPTEAEKATLKSSLGI